MFPGKTIPYKFILFASLLLIAGFVIENVNHKFQLNDFKVYYNAAMALTSGKQVYGTLFSLGSGYYKYSPFTALLFYPLTLLPYYVACVSEFILTSAAIVYILVLLLQIFSNYFTEPLKFPNLVLSISLICIVTHLVRELELGNVNVLLLFLLCLSLLYIIREKYGLAGLFLAIVIITKPFFIFLVIPLVTRRHFKTLCVTAIALSLFIIAPALIVGISKDIDLHKQWLNAILLHAGGYQSPNTIDAFIRNNIISSIPGYFQYLVLLLFLVSYLYFIRINIFKSLKNQNHSLRGFIMEWFILIASLPLLFRTDTEHFLMALPIILFILFYLFSKKNIWLTILFVAIIILYDGNSSDLLGKKLSLKVFDWGVLGISNLLLIVLAIFIYFTNWQKTISETGTGLLSDTKFPENISK